MTSGPATGRSRSFSADVTASKTAQDGFDTFRREWEAQVGEPWPLNGLDAAASSDFKINVQAVSARDVVIADVYSASYVGRTMPDHETDGWVLLHRLRHGSWRFGHPDGRGEDATIPAGSFIVRHDGPPALFDLAHGSTADVLFLPAPAVAPLPGGRPILGSARSAEARVLMAHAQTVRETVRDLTPTGLWAARDALLELAKGAIRREFDDARAPAGTSAGPRGDGDRRPPPHRSRSHAGCAGPPAQRLGAHAAPGIRHGRRDGSGVHPPQTA